MRSEPEPRQGVEEGDRGRCRGHMVPRADGYNFLHKTEGADINRLQAALKVPLTSGRPKGSVAASGEFSWKFIGVSKPRSPACGAMLGPWRETSPRRMTSCR